MRLGIDLRPLQAETRFRGIGKTLEFFLQAAAAILKEDKVVFYVEENTKIPALVKLFENHTIHEVSSFPLGTKRYFRSFLPAYRSANPSKEEVDVFLQFDAMLGIPKSVPVVAIFYDLIPLLFREKERQAKVKWSRLPKDRLAGFLYWHKYLRVINSYSTASHIIAISESSKRDFLGQYPLFDSRRISVAPLGVDKAFFDIKVKSSGKMSGVARDPFILYVGGIDTRKNIVELIDVFYALKTSHPNLRLVLAGKEFGLHDLLEDRGWFAALDRNKQFKKDVVYTGYVSQDELLYLYRRASCFVFPSKYEGFGLPILEAMAAGCPVVAYNNSSLPEVAGGAITLATNYGDFLEKIDLQLRNPDIRTHSIKVGRLHAQKFSWEMTAEKIVNIVRRTYVEE